MKRFCGTCGVLPLYYSWCNRLKKIDIFVARRIPCDWLLLDPPGRLVPLHSVAELADFLE